MVPTVSVVMPVYNAAGSVAAAMESICAQTLADWELLVVDDGSTDETAALIQKLGRREPRVRLLRIPHVGVVEALQEGLRHAQGEWIARMDADDRSHPERLAEQVRYLEQNPQIGLVSCLVEFVTPDAQAAGYARHVGWINELVTPEDIALNRFVESPLAHPSVMFRAALLKAHGGYRAGPFPEDYELWLRWLEGGVQMAKLPRVLLDWCDSGQRLSRIDTRYSFEAFYRCKAPYLARWLEPRVRGRPLLVWGAGRPTRRRAAYLLEHGVEIQGYIDIDPHKIGRRLGTRSVCGPDDIPAPEECFVVGYVAKHGARDLARAHLRGRGFREGQDFIMAA